MELNREYIFKLHENFFSIKKTNYGDYLGIIYITPETGHYSEHGLPKLLEIMSWKLKLYFDLNITTPVLSTLARKEDDQVLDFLVDSCRKANTAFWYNIPEKEDTTNKICNLCEHFNLLTGTCRKHGGFRNAKDTCKDFQKA